MQWCYVDWDDQQTSIVISVMTTTSTATGVTSAATTGVSAASTIAQGLNVPISMLHKQLIACASCCNSHRCFDMEQAVDSCVMTEFPRGTEVFGLSCFRVLLFAVMESSRC